MEGIQDIGGFVYVAFGSFGQPGGFIDIFQEDGTFVRQLAKGAPLSNPWGLAVAPKNFGKLSNTLLVSNNTSRGTINAFNSLTGEFQGKLLDESGANLFIDGLWALNFGSNSLAGPAISLFFTAGPNEEADGLFGQIVPVAAEQRGSNE